MFVIKDLEQASSNVIGTKVEDAFTVTIESNDLLPNHMVTTRLGIEGGDSRDSCFLMRHGHTKLPRIHLSVSCMPHR